MLKRIFKITSIKSIPRFFFTVNTNTNTNITDIKNQFLYINSKSTIELKDLYHSISICYQYPAYIPKDFLIKIENTSLTRIMAIDNKYYTILYFIMSNYGHNISNKFWMFMDRRLILDINKLLKEELIIIIESISKKYNKSNKVKVFPYINNMINQIIANKELSEDEYYSLIYSLIRLNTSIKSQIKYKSYTNIDSNLFEILQSKIDNKENDNEDKNLKSEDSNYNRSIITQILSKVLLTLKDIDIKIKNKYIKVIYDLYSNDIIKSNEIKNYISIIHMNDIIHFDNEKDIVSIYYLILVGYNIFFRDTSPIIEDLILKYFSLYDAYRLNHLLLLIVNSQFFNYTFKIKVINEFLNDLLSIDQMTGKELTMYINSTLELINISMINEETLRTTQNINDFYNEIIGKINKQIRNFDLGEVHEVLDILQYFYIQDTCKENVFFMKLLLLLNENDFIIQIENVIKSSSTSIKNTNFIYIQGLILTIYQSNSIISKINRCKLKEMFIEECNIQIKLLIENKFEKERLKIKSLIDLINKHID